LVGTKSNPELIIQKVKPQIICLGYDQKLPFNGKNFPNIKVTRISQLPSYKKSSNKVIGRVFSGKKRAQKFLSEKEYANRILAAIGFFVFPGTLNLALARNGVDDLLVEKKKKKIFSFYKDKEERGGLVLYPVMIRFFPLVPLKTKEKKVWVVFPEKTGYNKTVSEVVSKINLRELLNLLDGDLAEIVF
jgi:CTP-dependent riboflavin kinase